MAKLDSKKDLSARVLKVAFGLYLIVAVILVATQVGLEYDYEKERMNRNMQQLVKLSTPLLAEAITRNDTTLQTTLLNEMLASELITFAVVKDTDGKTLGAVGPEDVKSNIRNATRSKLTSVVYPINTPATNISTGTLVLYTPSDLVFQHIYFSLFLTAMNAILKSIALWFIFYWTMRRMVAKPLGRLTEAMYKLKPENVSEANLVMPKIGKKMLKAKDELGVLVRSFWIMERSMLEKGQQIVEYQQQLEDKVKQRTFELNKINDKLVESTKAKSEFLATMSHEIRTPMNGVIGMTYLLEQTDLKQEQKELVQTIRSSGDSLLIVINDILDFSKVEAGKIELENLPMDLKDCIKSAQLLLAHKAKEKGIELRYSHEAESPEIVYGDVTRVRQILINLIGNGIKFTDRGYVACHVSHKKLANERYEIQFAVQDTGLGISKEAQERLFQAFSQAEASTTRMHGGTGLGLAISKGLVETMGGRIWLESDLGRGSTFFFTIVTKKGTREQLSEQQHVSAPIDYELGSKKPLEILLAEDNIINQKVAAKFLKKIGYDVDLANNGVEAVDAIAKKDFDVVFMDMEMPEMGGLEATTRIIAMKKDRRPHIIAMTANAMSEDRNRCLDAGMDDYVSKPLKMKDLMDVLEKVEPKTRGEGDSAQKSA